MGGLTQHDVVVAVIGALVGSIITVIPAWIAVSQVRRTRLKAEVSDVVDAKVGYLVGSVFANLVQLQNDAEATLRSLKADLDNEAKRITLTVQSDLAEIVTSARKTMDDLRSLASQARASASEIDMLREKTTAAGIDLEQLQDEAWIKRVTRDIERNKEKRLLLLRDLNRLHELRDVSSESEGYAEIEELTKKYNAERVEDAITEIALQVGALDRDDRASNFIIENSMQRLASRTDVVSEDA